MSQRTSKYFNVTSKSKAYIIQELFAVREYKCHRQNWRPRQAYTMSPKSKHAFVREQHVCGGSRGNEQKRSWAPRTPFLESNQGTAAEQEVAKQLIKYMIICQPGRFLYPGMTSLLLFVLIGRMEEVNVVVECSMTAPTAIIPGSILKTKRGTHEL